MTIRNFGNVDEFGVREPIVAHEVYVANKRNRAQLTHIFVDDGGVFGSNLIGSSKPVDLLPATPADSDAIYFGIEETDSGAGFMNLVFDITTVATYTGAATLDWEVWDAAWVAADPATTDNTDDGSGSFELPGVRAMASGTVNPTTTVNGVTGHWVRAVVNLGGGTVSQVPQQGNRDIYTVTWPYVEIQNGAIGGDIPAELNVKIQPIHGVVGGTQDRIGHAIFMAARSVERGPEFTPYIVMSDQQEPRGVNVSAAANTGSSFTDRDDQGLPVQRVLRFDPGTSSSVIVADITFAQNLVQQYSGKFKVYLRYLQLGASTTFTARVSILPATSATSGDVITETESVSFIADAVAEQEFVDLGILSINPRGNFEDSLRMQLKVSFNNTTDDIDFIDLILMPVDEWAAWGGFDYGTTLTGKIQLINNTYLETNGLEQKSLDTMNIRDDETRLAQFSWPLRTTGKPVVRDNSRLRLYFFMMSHASNTLDVRKAPSRILSKVTITANQRYLAQRGNR